MSDWYKADAEGGTNLKMKKAGRLGREMFRGLLELLKKHGRKDVIPATRADPDAIALSLPAYEFVGDEAGKALDACEAAGLVKRLKDGAVKIVGYDSDWMPGCSKCGKPNEEQRFRTCASCRKGRKGNGSPQPETPEPFEDVPNGSSNVANGSEDVRTVRAGHDMTGHDRSTTKNILGTRTVDPKRGGGGGQAPPGDSCDDPGRRVFEILSDVRGKPCISNTFHRRVRAQAFVIEDGGTVEDAEQLRSLAVKRGKNPAALMAHWLKSAGGWKDVLAEVREKQKQRGQAKRGKRKGETKSAGQVLDQVLPKPRRQA